MIGDERQAHSLTMDRVDPKTPYDVPDDIGTDAGDLFSYVCRYCYGTDLLSVWEFFGVSRQAFWIWRKHGKGVPTTKINDLNDLVASPDHAFRLPRNVKIEDLLRPARHMPPPSDHRPAENWALIDLLNRICTSAEYGQVRLSTIASLMSRPVPNPSVFYRWAWADGGVPPSYVGSFLMTVMQLRIHELYGFNQETATEWECWALEALPALNENDHTIG